MKARLTPQNLGKAASIGTVGVVTIPSIVQTLLGDSGNSTPEVLGIIAYFIVLEICSTYRATRR